MAALGWLLNLDFAASGLAGIAPPGRIVCPTDERVAGVAVESRQAGVGAVTRIAGVGADYPTDEDDSCQGG